MSFNLENLTATGILAAVLTWFMMRNEQILKDLTTSLNNLTLAVGKCPKVDEKTDKV